MNKLSSLFLKYFCYCGLSADQYRAVKHDAYKTNFSVWRYLHLLILFLFLCTFVSNFFYINFEGEREIRMVFLIYSIIACILNNHVLSPEKVSSQVLIYISSAVLISFGIVMALSQVNSMAVTFVLMLVIVPMFIINRPCYISCILIVAGVIYILLCMQVKEGEPLNGDCVNTIVYTFVGIVISVVYNSMRFSEFNLIHEAEKNVEEINLQLQRETNLFEANERAEKLIIKRTSELNEKNRIMAQTNDEIMEFLGELVEFRDTSSGEHIKRVKSLSYILARQVMQSFPEYGLTEEDIFNIASASSLHDIGKISIPDSILFKPGKLTDEEFEIMKKHSEIGYDILMRLPNQFNKNYIKMSMEICRHHHEKWDGRGYPDGLAGDDIPISAQIVSIADCYDALTTERVYKAAYTHEEAFDMIFGGKCGVFSPKLLECCRICEEDFKKATNIKYGMNLQVPMTLYGSNKLKGVKILLVDDDSMSLDINHDILVSEGADVVMAESGLIAVSKFRHEGPFDALIIDVVMPNIDGVQTTALIREIESSHMDKAFIIALSAEKNDENLNRMLQAGADAFLEKPLVIAELSSLLLSHMRKRSESLEKILADTLKVANTDPLTHVKNITAYTDVVAELTEKMKSSIHPQFAVVMCDLNDLKSVNDTFGHDAGDQYIRNGCNLICDAFTHSPVYRIGGDEFVAILQGNDYKNRDNLFKILRDSVLEAEKKDGLAAGMTSMATGMSDYDMYTDFNVSDVVKRADTAMYSNKRSMKAKIRP